MVKVRLGGTLMSSKAGGNEFEVEATTIQEMLAKLADQHPELKPVIERGVAVAIDGTIYRGAFLKPIPEGAEVFLLPHVAGG